MSVDLVSERNAADILGIARATLRSRRHRGRAPEHVLIDGQAFYDPAHLAGEHVGRRRAGRPRTANPSAAARRDRWIREHGSAHGHACSRCGDLADGWTETQLGTFRPTCGVCRAS